MKKILRRLFRIGEPNQFGTQTAILMTDELPRREEIGTVSEELRQKFEEYHQRKAGLESSLSSLALEIGKLRLAEAELWPEVYKELGIEDGENSHLSINRKTGLVTRIYEPSE